MWNLFSAVEPKVIRPARSMKESMLLQQAKALGQIQQQANAMLGSINAILKSNPQKFPQNQSDQLLHSNLAKQLKETVNSLHDRLLGDNQKFEEYITFRDQEKINQQEFFKATMKSYEVKKSELNKYIQQLQEKVQELEILGFKTYALVPKQDNVLSGINQKYIDKYLAKQQIIKNIEQGVKSIKERNNQKRIKAKNSFVSTQFAYTKNKKVSILSSPIQCNSLDELEQLLQSVLLKEEIVGQMLTKKIKNCKHQFQNLASQELTFKQGLKKIGVFNEEKRRSSAKLSMTSKQGSLNTFGLRKISNQFASNRADKAKTLNPSMYHQKFEGRANEREEQNQFDQQIGIQTGERQEEIDGLQIPSTNFLEACEDLITERFIEEDKSNTKDMIEKQVDNEQ